MSQSAMETMTDPMKPLGLSLFQLTALPRMYEWREAVRRRRPEAGVPGDARSHA